MSTLGERVAEERAKQHLSQTQLAWRITELGFPISQQGIAQIEARGNTKPRCLQQLAMALGVMAEWLRTGKEPKTHEFQATYENTQKSDPLADLRHLQLELKYNYAKRDLPTWTGELVRGRWLVDADMDSNLGGYSIRPDALQRVKNAFGLYVMKPEMEPVYRVGDFLMIDTGRTPKVGADCIFLKPDKVLIHQREVTLGRLEKIDDKQWTISRYAENGEHKLKRSQWLAAYPIFSREIR